MANNKLEMVGQFIPGTTDYPVTIPDFVPNMTVVIYIKVTAVTDTYSQTTAVLASSDDYTFLLQGDGKYNIQFKSAVTSQYVAFVVRQPYTKPVSSWNDLVSNANINYIALNEENKQIYEDFYTQFDFQADRVMTLETAYKWEEMKLIPYLDEEFIWLKRGGKIIGIHRTELIKEQLDEILGILSIMRDIQTDVTTKYADIIVKWNDIKTLAAQVLIWRNDTEQFYNLSVTLKNQMEDLYTDFETMADSKYNSLYNLYNDSITSINNTLDAGLLELNNLADTRISEMNTLINTGKTDITNLKNTAITEINADKNSSLDVIETAKNQAIQDIIDAASEIIGGDFLTRGGTKYNNAKEIETDIDELKSRPSGAAVIIGEIDETTSTSITLILNKADLSGQETISRNIQYTMIAGSGVGATAGLTVNVKVNGTVYPLKRETFNGSTVYTDVKSEDLIQYQTYIFFYNPWSAAYYVRTNFLATDDIPGLITKKQVTLAQYDYVDVNVTNTRANADILTDLYAVYQAGKKARLINFQFPNSIPNPGVYNEGILSFEFNGSSSLLFTFRPKYINNVLKMEAVVPIVSGAFPTSWNFYTRDNWKWYGTEEFIGINQTVTFDNTTTSAMLTAAQCGITGSLDIFKEITLMVSVRTLRHQNSNGTVRLELGGKFRLQQKTGASSGQDTINYLNNKSGTDVIRVMGTKSIREVQLNNNWLTIQLSNSGDSYVEPIDGNCIIQIIAAIGTYY